jgi:hypothetical protein
MDKISKNLLALISAIVAIAGFWSIIASSSVRAWVKGHFTLIFYGLVATTLALMLSIDYAIRTRRSYRNLSQSYIQQTATEHDRRMYREFISKLQPDSGAMRWLKQDFLRKAIPLDKFKLFESLNDSFDLDPVGFDDPLVQAAYLSLQSEIGKMCASINYWTWADDGNVWLSVPLDWRDSQPEKYLRVTEEIDEGRLGIIVAYDEFLLTCHNQHLD